MAVIGLRYPVWAPYASGGSGEAIVYGTPVTDAHAIEANISWSRNTNNLYADDTIVEYDNSIMSGTISLMIDNLSANEGINAGHDRNQAWELVSMRIQTQRLRMVDSGT